MNLLDAMRYLAALEQHRHFGRAALACHITQPALSNALRALESELGTSIVRRGRQYEGLTPEGERVLASARRMLHEQELLRQDLASSAGQPQGVLTLGAVPTAVPVAAQFAVWLRRNHPGLRVVLRGLSSPAIEAGLENLAVDLALGYTGRPDAQARSLQIRPQYEEHYFAVRREPPADEPVPAPAAGLSLGAPLRWADLAHQPLLLLTPEMHNRSIIDAAFESAAVAPPAAIETDSVLALITAVQTGPFSAVLPGALLRTLAPQAPVTVHPLVEPELRTPIGFMSLGSSRPSRALEAAQALAASVEWLAHLKTQTGAWPA
ncbi:transcriptional regulator, LysR family [Leptothrix cholodnii SP-6]|uniref:Transcriptional regulator, LysR family n=1 Tax=Leptothrix cholodnii (strain ATCC 51168 / LMG 8142 / SP-6) TaxID=395495 RepID=B1XWL7_LEPCP|nr:LysR substrate-binding domain-containing protein [Leptothrix cholodnii]ACB35018.1 transcriptional regulator, LysR family [Leptothrix cholodnii SP-6]